jgi:hypothetical protein
MVGIGCWSANNFARARRADHHRYQPNSFISKARLQLVSSLDNHGQSVIVRTHASCPDLVSADVRTFRTFLLIWTFLDILEYVRTFGQNVRRSRYFLDKSIGHGETIRFLNYDVSKTITASEISTIMRKLFRSFLGQIGRFWSFVPVSE